MNHFATSTAVIFTINIEIQTVKQFLIGLSYVRLVVRSFSANADKF